MNVFKGHPTINFDHLKYGIDRTSQSYLETYCDSNFYQNFIPILVPISDDDENSFYNSLAYLSNFENDIIMELKVKNICELVLNCEFYQGLCNEDPELKYHINRQLRLDHKQITVWDFMGIASVLNIAIQSVFPNVNGANDQTAKNRNQIFFPRNSNRQGLIQITLLWTNSKPLNQTIRKMLWRSNRIIPLLKLYELKTDLEVIRLLYNRPQDRGVFYAACPCGCDITQNVLNQIVPENIRRQREIDLYHRRQPEQFMFMCPTCQEMECNGYIFNKEKIKEFQKNYKNSLLTCILFDVSSSMKQSFAPWPLSYVIGKSKLSIGIAAIIQLLHNIASSTARDRKHENPTHDSNQLLMYTFDDKLLEPPVIPVCDAVDASNFADKVENIRCSKRLIGTSVYEAIDQILDKLEQVPYSNYHLFIVTDNCDTKSNDESKRRLSNIKFTRHELNTRLLYVQYGDIQGNSKNVEDNPLAAEADVRIYLNDNIEQARRMMEIGYSKIYEDGTTITSSDQQSNILYDRNDRIPNASRIHSSNTQQYLVNSAGDNDQIGQNFQPTMQHQISQKPSQKPSQSTTMSSSASYCTYKCCKDKL
ncbi:unnamed protein product [Didymodactylos carnosus]|uniref:VWFA domain-containing protein n=1 Tax=Didymodactylos carnosus TaxID=1234261 RepID=A0A814C313_9BILA|nr:unnamed protein product [Didymodactylos carnosus]CAF0934773.1 unnamed protein product [Didymodactylos carnosus]CAF3547838.1 unnamed protein product [Didymodactylos carnosus]CAF3712215.1 unnamed protein product [Didymodactylos carnosus]